MDRRAWQATVHSVTRGQTEWLTQFCKEFQDTVICVSLGVEPEPNPKAALLFLGCSSLVFASLLFPDWQLFKSALWNSGKVMEAGVYSLQETGGHVKVSVPRSPSGSFSVSWVEVGLLIKKSEVLQEKETAYTKTQKSALGGEKGKTQSLQTAWPFWSCNNHGAGGKRGEIKLEGARGRGQAIPKLQECTWRDLEFILRTGGNQKGFSAGKRRNGMGISSFCHQGGGWIRGVRLWVESPTGSLAVSRKSILRTQRRAMPMMMTRRELDLECNEDWSARGDLQFSLQSSEAQLNSLNHVPYFVNSWHNALHRMCACMLSRSVMSNFPWTVQGKILEWIATSYSRGSSNPGIEHVSPALSGWFYHFATREALPQDRSLIKSC